MHLSLPSSESCWVARCSFWRTAFCTVRLPLWERHGYTSFQSEPLVSYCRHLVDAVCTGKSEGLLHSSLFSWQNLHSEICGKRDKVEELLKHADQCSAAIKVLGFQHFYRWLFSWSGSSYCLHSSDRQNVSSLGCVCACKKKLLGKKIIIYTKDNKSNPYLPSEDGTVIWEIPMNASLQENQSLLLATPTFPVHMLKMRVENRWVALKCDLIRIWSRRLDKCRLWGGMVGSSHENWKDVQGMVLWSLHFFVIFISTLSPVKPSFLSQRSCCTCCSKSDVKETGVSYLWSFHW